MKNTEKYIGLVCQNEPLFQELFNKIVLNVIGQKEPYKYRLITFDNTRKIKYDYILFVESYPFFEINKLRYYIYNNECILILNNDLGEEQAFKQSTQIISYSFDSHADYKINNINVNNNIIFFDLEYNGLVKPMYFCTKNEDELNYLISIIIFLICENYNFNVIKNIVQKIK